MATKPEPFRSLGFAAVSWIEHYLVHGPGDVQGQSIELDDEFAAFIVKAGEVDRRGQRKIRRAFLSRSKGRSKSGMAAMIECYEALGPCRFDHWAIAGEASDWGYEYDEGEPVGKPLGYVEILNVATEEGQAGNTYDAVVYMLDAETCSPNLLADHGRLDVGLTRINLPNKRGFIEPVTASNESKDGGKSTFIVADETHLWIPPTSQTAKFRLGKMHQTMVRNLLKRKLASGWMLETSTMYAAGEGSVAEGTHAYAKQLAKSGRRDGKLLFDHRQASDHWDLNKRAERIGALKEAYGPAAAWMDLEAIADYWDDPQASEAEFRRFWLNQPVPTVEVEVAPVFGEGKWEAVELEPGDRPIPGAIGVAISVDRAWVSLGSCGAWDDGSYLIGSVNERRRHGEMALVESEDEEPRRVPWIVVEAKRIQDTYGCAIVVDGRGPAADLIPTMQDEGVDVVTASTDDYLNACSNLFDAVGSGEATHMGDEELQTAVGVAVVREVGDRWAWGRRKSMGDISVLEAVTLAWFGRDMGWTDIGDSVL